MEHLQELKAVLAERCRILKPGGKMIYTGPIFYEEHEQPCDFYRYTQLGPRHLLASTGYTIDRIDWLEGYFGTVRYQLNTLVRYLSHKSKDLGQGLKGYGIAPIMVLLKETFAAPSILFHGLETRMKFTAMGYPKNYVAVVGKARQEHTPQDHMPQMASVH